MELQGHRQQHEKTGPNAITNRRERPYLCMGNNSQSLEALLIALAAAGCGEVASDMDMMTDPGDTVAPLVVSSTPAAGTTGAASDVKIHITFSEPMDPATVEAGYASEKLPLDKVSTSWNAEQTVLTISPDAALLYGDGIGNDPSTATRITYAISIGTEATDLAGNPLEAAYELGFSTKVRMSTTAAFVDALTASTLGGSALPGDNIIVGDASVNDLPYRGYVTFDISALPQDITIESAAFAARQTTVEGTPYASLGPLNVYHLTFSTMTDVGDVLPISFPGVLSEDGNAESKSIDVTAQLTDDLANRAARGETSQYRLQFDTVSEDNEYDRVYFPQNTFEMSLVYVAD